MRVSSYLIDIPLPDTDMSLLFHGYSGAVDLVPSRIADSLRESVSTGGRLPRDLSQETRSLLTKRGYLTERTPEAERAYVVELGRRVHGVMKKHASPGFLVIPTYGCNLRCPYCYERGLQEKGAAWLARRMSAEMVEAAIEAMDRIDGSLRRPRCLTFYGGEPLQRSNEAIIRLLHDRACKKGFRRFSAITNAVELDHYSDLLGEDRKISFLQVTIDGPPTIHDKRRFLRDGGGTFVRIIQNIELAIGRGTRVSVRINVDRDNASRVGWLKDYFQERGWSRHSLFRAYCSPVHGSICGKADGNSFTSYFEMRHAIKNSANEQEDANEPAAFQTDAMTHAVKKRILAHLLQKQGLPFWRTAFCGSNMAMYLFDPFGDIYPCWEVIGHPVHRIGIYGPGHLEFDREALHRWHHRSVVQISGCQSCPYLFFCGGGCEAFAYEATGKLDRPHCFDFPRHFRRAARLAYSEWKSHQTANPSFQ